MGGTARLAAASLLLAAAGCRSGGPAPEVGAIPVPGLDRIAEEGAGDLRGLRVGLVSNHTGRTRDGTLAVRVLLDAGVEVRVLFGPEHGFSGRRAAGDEVASGRDPDTGLPVISLYGADFAPGPETLAGLDALVFDIQDIGVRFYTYISTLRLALEAAGQAGLGFWVLDRPNPNRGDRVEGPMLDAEFRSFVGTDRIPLLHGMTAGELALLFGERAGYRGRVRVVTVRGLARASNWGAAPWVPTSPNIPTLHAAHVYPAFGLFEGVLLSEGRGTPTPFELVGAPWVDPDRWLREIDARGGLPGLRLEPASFTPRPIPAAPRLRFPDEEVRGLRASLTDLDAFRPVRAGLTAMAAVRAAHPDRFAWRETGQGFWLDQLLGTDRIRLGIEQGVPVPELMDREAAAVAAFLEERRPHLLYP